MNFIDTLKEKILERRKDLTKESFDIVEEDETVRIPKLPLMAFKITRPNSDESLPFNVNIESMESDSDINILCYVLAPKIKRD